MIMNLRSVFAIAQQSGKWSDGLPQQTLPLLAMAGIAMSLSIWLLGKPLRLAFFGFVALTVWILAMEPHYLSLVASLPQAWPKETGSRMIFAGLCMVAASLCFAKALFGQRRHDIEGLRNDFG